ncbi:hypothetical protein [Caldisericum exile]|uniref:Uncharacterized protein n=1 Tax=Caldisericum exile (strain DSM 21853 / NBRC 104410 / AZM16c01) TaxID=511051 RepID=A0A7U6JF81_CALEA|nr:hypothetical protein [Caldisericum exile]BAL81516.1 hypothetical protein CSE_13900 [Caldisericum exile AZM16c01]
MPFTFLNNMAVVFTSTGKNNGTAIAIATMAFSPMVAIPAATMPIFQIIFLVSYLKAKDWVKEYFNRKGTSYIERGKPVKDLNYVTKQTYKPEPVENDIYDK